MGNDKYSFLIMETLKKGRSTRAAAIWLGTEINGETPAHMMKNGRAKRAFEILKKEKKKGRG